MSGYRASPRYDFVATTRRSWSREQKQAIVAEVDGGGATLSEVARRHGIHASLLLRWRKTLGSAMGSAPSVAMAKAGTSVAPAFMPVLLPPPSIPEPIVTPVRASAIEIGLECGRTLRVGTDVDTSALLRIIEALEKSR